MRSLPTIEIHRRRKLSFMIMCAMILIALPMNYFIFREQSVLFTIGCLIADVFLVHMVYTTIKTLNAKLPAIVLTEHVLELNENGKTLSFTWNEIEKIYVNADDANYDLIIHAYGTKKKFSIGLLDKTPQEIDSLIKTYRKDFEKI